MDLRRLGLFLAVVDHGGFTAAAKATYVAQPAISLAVHELERELGAALFVRSRRGAVLTPAGEALVGPARQAARDVENAAAAVAEVTGLLAGRLDVAALPTLAADPVAAMVGRFRSAHPAVVVRLAAPADPLALLDAVHSGAAEVGLTDASAVGGLDAHRIGSQELVAISPPGTAVRGMTLTVKSLASCPLVLTEPGSSVRALVEAAFAEAGVSASLAVETAQRDAVIPLVLAGAGTAVVPATLAANAAAQGAVVRALRPRLRRVVMLVHRPGVLSPAARRFVELAGS